MSPDPTPRRRRLAAGALAAGGALLAASLALKTGNSEDPRDLLQAIAATPGRFQASVLLELMAGVMLIPALLAFGWLLHGHGGRLGATALGLMFISTVGNIGDAGFGGFTWAAASDGVSAVDVSALEHAQSGAIYSFISLMVLIGLLGFPLLAVALYRARTVPVAVPALIGVAFASFFLPISEGIGGGLLAVAFAVSARELVSQPAAGRLEPLPA